MVGNQLKPNQRIYIGGKLKTENNMIGHLRHHNVEVMANELYFMDSTPIITDIESQEDTPPLHVDQNSVELLGFIGSEVRTDRSLSAFSIVTHFTKQ